MAEHGGQKQIKNFKICVSKCSYARICGLFTLILVVFAETHTVRTRSQVSVSPVKETGLLLLLSYIWLIGVLKV